MISPLLIFVTIPAVMALFNNEYD